MAQQKAKGKGDFPKRKQKKIRGVSLVEDQSLMQAVSGIRQRSERQQNLQKLIDAFVDVGILAQIDNTNNQIIYGRRGTGKTHIFKVLASHLLENMSNAIVYIDARTLGSTSQFSDQTVPMKQRCLSLFRDVLGEIYNGLLDYIVNEQEDNASAALEALNELGKVMTEPVSSYAVETVTSRKVDKNSTASSVDLSLGTKEGLALALRDNTGNSLEEEQTTAYRVAQQDKVIFPALHSLLKDVLQQANATLFILLDEWSSIPIDIQPYLAEFLKRGFFPNPHVVVKIASLEYRSNFGERHESGQILGFEIGSDISTALDIDDYYVYDRNPEVVTDLFSDMLYKHLKSELPDNYLESKYEISSGRKLVAILFTDRFAIKELVRASEGVARDLINIFTSAYFAAQRTAHVDITKGLVLDAAHQWFEQDKAKNLDEELVQALAAIVQEVVGHRRVRYFMLPREKENHPVIRRLFDSRVLHLVQRGHIDKRNPSLRYNTYTLDYGTYANLLKTNRFKSDKKIERDLREIDKDRLEVLPPDFF